MSNRIDGVDYSPEGVASVREQVVAMRDSLMDNLAENATLVIILSHNIAYLHDYMNGGTVDSSG